jgi:TMEM175 potassium channel family protein
MAILRARRSANDRDTTRLEAFSDGVIAVAITLLVLEVHVPDRLDIHSNRELWHALGKLWPSYLGYLTSFVVIGIMWANHHNIFKHIARADHYLILINTLLLLFIVFVPFTTDLLAEYLGHDGERTATIVYSGWFFATALVYNFLWRYASRWGDLLDPDSDPAAIATITRRFNYGPPSYGLAFAASLVYPPASLAILIALALLYALPSSAPV